MKVIPIYHREINLNRCASVMSLAGSLDHKVQHAVAVTNAWLHELTAAGVVRREDRLKAGCRIYPRGALTRPLNPKNNRRQRGK